MRKYLLLAILAAGTLGTACKKKPETPPGPPANADSKVSFTVDDGATFKDYRFQMNDVTAEESAAFETATGTLIPYIFGSTKDGKYDIDISGQWMVNAAETVTFNDENSMNIEIDGGDTLLWNLSSKLNQGTLTITKFGSVGQTIEGTFKGTFTSAGGGDVSVKDGKFTLTRDEDL